MIIDSHTHVDRFGWYDAPETIIRLMDEAGIAKSIIMIYGDAPDVEGSLEYIAEAIDKYPDRLIGYARMNPQRGEEAHPDRFMGLCRADPWQGEAAVREVRKGFDELGACGLYLDPWEEGFQANDDLVLPLVEEAAQYAKPVVINAGHARVSHPTQSWDLARRFPDVRFVACNGGQINICGL